MAEDEKNVGTSDSNSSKKDYVLELKRRLKETTEKKRKEAALAEKKSGTASMAKGKTSGSGSHQVSTIDPIERQDNIRKDNRTKKQKKSVEKDASKTGSGSAKGVLKKLGFVFVGIIVALALVVGGYVVYLQAGYSRIEDMRYLEVFENPSSRIMLGEEYSITTFNIGFGAYSQGYSFFMDEGIMHDGTITKGEYSRALNKDEVLNNTNGAISLVSGNYLSDFYFFQEVDTNSSRSYYVNQAEAIANKFSSYGNVFASNFHTGQLFYPLNQPIGKVNSGMMTLSKYQINYSVRRSFPVDEGFVTKFFDLDRCFIVTKLPIYNSSKFLVLINVHLSAYDDGNIRAEQLKMLANFIDQEYNKHGNYVVVGGDFNHAIAGDAGVFKNDMQIPDWCKNLPDEYSEENLANMGYKIHYDLSTTIGTCRDSSRHYVEGENLEVILDGFITSANVKAIKTETIDGDFKNSDHNPVRLQFVLE